MPKTFELPNGDLWEMGNDEYQMFMNSYLNSGSSLEFGDWMLERYDEVFGNRKKSRRRRESTKSQEVHIAEPDRGMESAEQSIDKVKGLSPRHILLIKNKLQENGSN